MPDVNLSSLLNILSLSTPTLSLYLVWFNRKNIYAHLGFPLILIAYVAPLIVFNEVYEEYQVYQLYTKINLVGAISFFTGVLIAKIIPSIRLPFYPFYQTQQNYHDAMYKLRSRTLFMLLFACILMIISYIGMGFTPMFADDPVAAKFFRGEYQETYQKVAILFRTGNLIIPVLLPLAILFIIEKFDYKLFLVVSIGIICIALSLQRTPIGFSILTPILIYAAYKSRLIFHMIFFAYIFVYIFGAAFWWLLGITYNEADISSFLKGAMAGTPDVPDQLGFLSGFVVNNTFAYGKTFIGGLIPFGYEWNPSAYTLRIANGVNDISQISSGGLRLPVYIWGYVNFSWLGVVIVSLLSGYLSTHMILFMKKSSFLKMPFFCLNYIYATTALVFFVNFYNISIYSITNLVFGFIFFHMIKWKLIVNKKN
ncbi:O-antigen polymerase [Photorhabdus laumondii]|uniref:O-antigen polymerase n=1 Tax=Photorhabdus laumondii TaxID=2218628 RepID=UPI003315D7A3